MKHRTALVSAMSIAGVVLAGATAVGANLGILNSSQGLGEISAVEPVTTSTALTAPASTPPTVPVTTPQPDLVAYQINGVGVVTIARHGSDLKLDSADVGDWSYEVSGQGEALTMAFRFEEREIQFEAALTDGQIVVDVWEEQVIVETAGSSGSAPATAPATAPTTQATSVTTAPPVTSGTWDDDDHEDHEDDSYDDDSHESDDDSHESDDDDGGDDDD